MPVVSAGNQSSFFIEEKKVLSITLLQVKKHRIEKNSAR